MYLFVAKDDKPYFATFGQISSKSNEAFSNKRAMLRSLGGGPINKNIKMAAVELKAVSLIINKTQYDWFPGKSQNSKKFHIKS